MNLILGTELPVHSHEGSSAGRAAALLRACGHELDAYPLAARLGAGYTARRYIAVGAPTGSKYPVFLIVSAFSYHTVRIPPPNKKPHKKPALLRVDAGFLIFARPGGCVRE